jgi:hypothetical protein
MAIMASPPALGVRLPEADAVPRRHRAQELVHLGVHVEREAQVVVGALLGEDEVVAVHRARHRHLVEAGGHELEQRHLRGGVLHGDPIRTEVGVALAAGELLALGVEQVVHQDLLAQRERSSEPAAAERDPLGQPAVDGLDQLDRRRGGDGHAHGPPCSSTCHLQV